MRKYLPVATITVLAMIIECQNLWYTGMLWRSAVPNSVLSLSLLASLRLDYYIIFIAGGTNLRTLLVGNGINVYRSLTRWTNCSGKQRCGTCIVEVRYGREGMGWVGGIGRMEDGDVLQQSSIGNIKLAGILSFLLVVIG